MGGYVFVRLLIIDLLASVVKQYLLCVCFVCTILVFVVCCFAIDGLFIADVLLVFILLAVVYVLMLVSLFDLRLSSR